MDTLVELYDKEPLENVLAGCIFAPSGWCICVTSAIRLFEKSVRWGACSKAAACMWKRGSII